MRGERLLDRVGPVDQRRPRGGVRAPDPHEPHPHAFHAEPPPRPASQASYAEHVGLPRSPAVAQPHRDVLRRVEHLALHDQRVDALVGQPAGHPLAPVLAADVHPVGEQHQVAAAA